MGPFPVMHVPSLSHTQTQSASPGSLFQSFLLNFLTRHNKFSISFNWKLWIDRNCCTFNMQKRAADSTASSSSFFFAFLCWFCCLLNESRKGGERKFVSRWLKFKREKKSAIYSNQQIIGVWSAITDDLHSDFGVGALSWEVCATQIGDLAAGSLSAASGGEKIRKIGSQSLQNAFKRLFCPFKRLHCKGWATMAFEILKLT